MVNRRLKLFEPRSDAAAEEAPGQSATSTVVTGSSDSNAFRTQAMRVRTILRNRSMRFPFVIDLINVETNTPHDLAIA